ncbi:heat-shock protein [Ahniella affigens]|uniref:Heat-shock protein n=1 Tax=Ahniella affigens TaxID=2021234 RepID=A0A2P1PSU4_9GAMM|nr:DegQ family serine endoprotease [Ahniella affigens]AVP97892.1 heat-shock protein [Ahniella affigens]
MRRILFCLSAILFACSTTPVLAQLPSVVDGQPMPSLAPMIERVQPAVVNINTETRVKVRDPFWDDPFFRRFFGAPNQPQRERVERSLGSGVIVDAAKGLVLTNNHVIENAQDIKVTLADGRTLNGELVGTDPETDIAVIKVVAKDLHALPLADSSKLRVGDFVVAIGNPFGLGQTVTSGIVSALGRSGLRGVGVQNFIQTDASINPGNSGGALVNLRGELIGINTAIFTPSGGNVGIGFAVPADLVREVIRQLVQFGEVKRGSLGVESQDISEEMATVLGVKMHAGVVLTRVLANSPAEVAGLKVGDVITALNGKAIGSVQELINAEALLPVGQRVIVKIVRDGKPLDVPTVLKPAELRQLSGERLDPRLSGAQFGDLPDKYTREGVSGVLVTRVTPGSKAEQVGLQKDDLVRGINRAAIADLTQFEQYIEQKPRQIVLTVVRGNQAFYVVME